MAQNFISSGEVMDYQNGGTALAVGVGVKIGVRIGVTLVAIAANATGSVQMNGVFKVAKAASQAWTQGALVYWDDTNKVFTTTSIGNTLAGYAFEPVANGAGDVIGYVKLNA